MDRAGLQRTKFPLPLALGIDLEDLVLSRQFPAMITPGGRIKGGQNGCGAEDAHTDLSATNVLDFEIAAGHVSDELGLIVSFERIAEHEIVSHDSIERDHVAANQRLQPFVVHLPQQMFNFKHIQHVLLRQFAA